MATVAEVARRIDHDLWAINAELSFLPDLERDWDDETADNRMIYSNDWGQMMSFLVALHRAHETGEMSNDQRAAYRDLARRLLAALPQLRRLELVMAFPVPLETVADSQE